MFGRVPFANPYEQIFEGYPVHQFQPQPFGAPLAGQMSAGFPGVAWQNPQAAGFGPIGPLVPQQGGFGQYLPNPYQQQFGGPGAEAFGFQQNLPQRDPRAELLATAIAQITAMRDPRIEYLSQIVTHPVVASNPILKEIVAKELLTTALQQVTFKSTVRPETQGIDPYTSQLLRGGLGQSQNLTGIPFA